MDKKHDHLIVSVSMSPQMKRDIDQEAKIQGMNRSALIRQLWTTYRAYLKEKEGR